MKGKYALKFQVRKITFFIFLFFIFSIVFLIFSFQDNGEVQWCLPGVWWDINFFINIYIKKFTITVLWSCYDPTGILNIGIIHYIKRCKKHALWLKNKQTVVSKKVKHNLIFFVYILSYDSSHFQQNHFSNL